MEEILDKVLSWAIPVLCGALLGGGVACYKLVKRKIKALSDGVCALLRADIIREHKEYSGKKYCPVYAKDAITKTYQAYHGLGGNDVATGLYNDIMALPEMPPNENQQNNN